jgi:DNA primase
MDPASFRHLIDDIRERTDLVKLVGETIALTPSGSVLRGRSSRHRDKTPSFVVWPHTQTWRDYAGGGAAGGDCFDFVCYRDGGRFMDAVSSLAARAGVVLPGTDHAAMAAEARQWARRRRLQELLTAAATYCHRTLPPAIRDRWFHQQYGFTDSTIDSLLLGWSDGHLYEHFTSHLGVSEDEALATGLFVRLRGGRIKDFFVHRLVFPYWKDGRVIYFIARATEQTPDEPWETAKYKKLLIRSKRHPYVSSMLRNDTFYNEDVARRADELVITEGITDCISAMQAGVACISPGTVRFRRSDHAKLLDISKRATRVILCNDVEDSGAGEEGAVATAQLLFAAGRDVRIARLPRSEGEDKLDLNSLMVTQGADALERVLREARRLPEHLIERIPEDTPKSELGTELAPILALIRASEPLLREAYQDRIRERFGLKAATVKALLQAAPPPSPSPEDEQGTARRGEVFERADHYYAIGREGEPLILSSFRIEPVQRIVIDDEGEILDARVIAERGQMFSNIRFPREAWNSRHSFLKILRPIALQWSGSDENVQGVLRLVAAQEVPTRRGTRNLGYLDTEAGPRWVVPDTVLAPQGADVDEEIVYVPSGSSLADRVRIRPPADPRAEGAAAAILLPELLHMNTPEVMLPILGWFFAAPLKPRIVKHLGRFPLLVVWGTQGSGKSSLIMDVLWPLFGVVSSEPYSSTETEFALLKLLSATNSVPVFIDEYKPFDMPRYRRNLLHRYMRRLYTGEVEERGRVDQSVVTYRLSAPVCMAGETRPIEPALVERMLTANPDKDALVRNPDHARAFARSKSVDPGLLTAGILRFLLGRDTRGDLERARHVTHQLIKGREVPFRVRDNLTVMMLGLQHFCDYAASLGIPLPALSCETAVWALLDDLLESGGSAVKSGLDYFLEELSVMAIAGSIEHGRHYVYRDGLLALHFPSCHAAFTEHCRRIGYDGEVPDRKALRRQIVENQRRGGYIREVNERVCFAGRSHRRRAVLVNLEEAKRALAVEEFPQPDHEQGYAGAVWEPYPSEAP